MTTLDVPTWETVDWQGVDWEPDLICPNRVRRDPHVNRLVEDRAVEKMVRDGFNPLRAQLSGYAVSLRDDDSYVWIDGQHRGGAAVATGHGDTPIFAIVLKHLSPQQEADWVLLLNEGRRATSYPEQHRLGVNAHREVPIAAQAVASRYGVEIDGQSRRGHIAAIRAVHSIVGQPDGAEIFARTLATLIPFYERVEDDDMFCVLGRGMLTGVALFWRRHPEVSVDELRKKMQKAGFVRIHSAAEDRGKRGGSMAQAVCFFVEKAYDRGRGVHSRHRLNPPEHYA